MPSLSLLPESRRTSRENEAVRRTAIVGAAATVLAALSPLWHHNLATVDWWVRLVATAILATTAVLASISPKLPSRS